VDEKFSDYSEDAAWPIVIDEYVAWRRKQVGTRPPYGAHPDFEMR